MIRLENCSLVHFRSGMVIIAELLWFLNYPFFRVLQTSAYSGCSEIWRAIDFLIFALAVLTRASGGSKPHEGNNEVKIPFSLYYQQHRWCRRLISPQKAEKVCSWTC